MVRDPAARRMFFVLLVISLLLVGAVVLPLAGALFMAAVLAPMLAGVHERLAARRGGRRGVSAALIVLGVLLLLVGPLVAFSTFLVAEATDGVKFIYETVRSEGVVGLVDRLPAALQDLAHRALASLGDVQALIEKQLSAQGARAAAALGTAVMATGSLIFDLAMMLVALFFLLVHGREFVAWLDSVSPMGPGQTRELLAEFKKVSFAVIVATVITAAVQTAAALVGYLIAGVPHPIFFTGLTFFVALIPMIGAAAVCLFAALILLITGHAYMALFLAAWGVVVVGLIDNVVKPYVMQGDVDMGGAVIFFALIGGLITFGPLGLLLGPLSVSFFLALLRMYRRDYKQPASG